MEGKTVCVTGASGFVASWLIMRLLQRGYFVKATLRDPENMEKVKNLWDLPNARTHLTFWRGDLFEEGSFDDAVNGCSGVFHVATPSHLKSSQDQENEIIKPTVNGVLHLMRSCLKAKTVKRFVYTSTMAAVTVQPPPLPSLYDENCWSDVDFCYAHKITDWSYIVGKTKAEKAAMEFAKENHLQLVIINPSIVIGPFLTPSRPQGIEITLSIIFKNEEAFKRITQFRAVHVDDLCCAHIFLLEHPQASGRYLCSNHISTVLDLKKSLSQKYPEYNITTQIEGVDESLKATPVSTKKLMDLGFTFKYDSTKYDLVDLCVETIEFCKEKGLFSL